MCVFRNIKIIQNGRPDTSACEDITSRNLCAYLTSNSLDQAQMRIKRLAKLKIKEIAGKKY